jgi:hypothetical protein
MTEEPKPVEQPQDQAPVAPTPSLEDRVKALEETIESMGQATINLSKLIKSIAGKVGMEIEEGEGGFGLPNTPEGRATANQVDDEDVYSLDDEDDL